MSKISSTKRIHLDTKDWITLVKVDQGIETDPELVEVYEKIKKLSDSGDAIFPISFMHLEDIMIRKDDESRNKLIDLIMEISKGYVLKPYTFFIQDEVINAACHRLGKQSMIDIKSTILGKGISHIVSKRGMKITWNKEKVDLPDDLVKEMKELADKPEAMKQFLKDGGLAEQFRQDRSIVDEAAKQMEKNRQEKMKLDKKDRFNQAIGYFLYDVVSPPTSKISSWST